MKTRSILLSGLLILTLAGCASSGGGGGGGGLFSAGNLSTDVEHWDLMMLLNSPSCGDGFASRGAAVNPTFPGGIFPGVKLTNTSGMYSGVIPEVKVLSYLATMPLVAPGDRVRVKFDYLANGDGNDGDYFLVRLLDGDKFHVPIRLSTEEMAKGKGWQSVDFTYQSQTDGFGLEFIIGLSSAADSFRLDGLQVKVNKLPLIIDHLEFGDYTSMHPAAVAPAPILYVPFLPTGMRGSVGVDFEDRSEGEGSLLITGGSYFVLDGYGGTFGDFSGVQLSIYDETMSSPFFDELKAMKQQQAYLGVFKSETSDPEETCSEYGNIVAAINPTGNADVSGNWVIQMLVKCQEPGLGIVNLDGTPATFGMTTISPVMLYFNGTPFTSTFGDNIVAVQGLTLGDTGFFMLAGGSGTSAVLEGVYDPTNGIFAGQVVGSLPVGGMTCTVDQGQFMAVITPAPPPM